MSSTRPGPAPSPAPAPREHRQDPFARALRAALAAQRRSIAQVAADLRSRGLVISGATLGYWASGRSRPRRARSLGVVRALEEMLDLADGALVDHLDISDSWRFRSLLDVSPADFEVAEVLALLEEWGMRWDDGLRRIAKTFELCLDPVAGPRRLRVELVLEAERDGADRLVTLTDPPIAGAGRLQGERGAAVGRERLLGTGRVASELLLERPLERGEAVVVEYLVPLLCTEEEIQELRVRSMRPCDVLIASVQLPPGLSGLRAMRRTSGIDREGEQFGTQEGPIPLQASHLQAVLAEVLHGQCVIAWEHEGAERGDLRLVR